MRLTVALELSQLGLSQYGNHDFNSYCQLGDVTLAAGAGGIMQLGGNDDAGTAIPAQIELALTDFGSAAQKRIRSIYVGYETDGLLTLSVVDDEHQERSYLLERVHPTRSQQSARVVVGRDGRGRYWQFKVKNHEGCDFSLDRLEVYPVILQSWVKG